MNKLLTAYFIMSVSASAFILILLCLRLLFKHTFSKKWLYYIWLVVIARLLIPYSPEIHFLEDSIIKYETNLVNDHFSETDKITNKLQTPDSNEYDLDKTAGLNVPAPSDHTVLNALDKILGTAANYLWVIWILTAVVLMTYKITLYRSFIRFLNAGKTEVTEIDKLEHLGIITEQYKIKKQVKLYYNPLISSPMLTGFVKPCIILPDSSLSESDFHYTIQHELTHYKKKDMFYKWLVQFTVCIHWFNPLSYLMENEINRACELSCDEAVVLHTGNSNYLYGDTLLNSIRPGKSYQNSLASITLYQNRNLIKERLESIMKCSKKSVMTRLTAWLITIMITTLAIAAGSILMPFTGQAKAKTNSFTDASSFQSSASEVPAFPAKEGSTDIYNYIQKGYYQDSYIFQMGYNVPEATYDLYPSRAELILSDQSGITVYFDETCKQFKNDEKALAALKHMIEKIRQNTDKDSLELISPLIVSVDEIHSDNLEASAQTYYTDGSLTRFSALFPELLKDLKLKYCLQMIDDGKIAFFASCIEYMDADIMIACREKAEKEDKITFLDVLMKEE